MTFRAGKERALLAELLAQGLTSSDFGLAVAHAGLPDTFVEELHGTRVDSALQFIDRVYEERPLTADLDLWKLADVAVKRYRAKIKAPRAYDELQEVLRQVGAALASREIQKFNEMGSRAFSLSRRPGPAPVRDERAEATSAHGTRSTEDRRRVFVIHGRDEAVRRAMFDFLRALLLQPLEWTQAIALTAKGSPYIGEILDAAFAKAQAVIALFTGDDEARLRPWLRSEEEPEEPLMPQARPNVLFEAGMAMGRNADRTIFVEVGQLRSFSDIGGRHVLRFDGSIAKRQELAQRLQTAGCAVDMSGTDWHHAGNFSVAKQVP